MIETRSNQVNQVTIVAARTADHLEDTRQLIRQFTNGFPYDLSFQNIETELGDLPGKFGPQQGGELLLAYVSGSPVGCVAYRQLDGDPKCAEMKRLYVRKEHRGLKIGMQLVKALLTAASKVYTKMRLVCVEPLASAWALYQKLGFQRIAKYNQCPFPDARFYELKLESFQSLDKEMA